MLYEKLLDEAIADLQKQYDIANYYVGKKILVTGGKGFIGRHVVQMLNGLGARTVTFDSKTWDLRNQFHTNFLFICYEDIDLVFHLAANVGGIGITSAIPGKAFYDNMLMGLNVIEQARLRNLKTVYAGSVCSYPEYTPVPFNEKNLWNGEPELSNRSYGLAKRAVGEMLDAYHRQYNLPSAYVLLGNTYGPFDQFDLATSHVIPALIRKFVTAKAMGAESVTVWGTGKVSRDFMFVTDAARALIVAGARMEKPIPVNVGSGGEVVIDWLVKQIALYVGYRGEIIYDFSKPDGARRRQLRIDVARKQMGWCPTVSVDVGLRATLEWYEANHE